jgi:hypothetical protein
MLHNRAVARQGARHSGEGNRVNRSNALRFAATTCLVVAVLFSGLAVASACPIAFNFNGPDARLNIGGWSPSSATSGRQFASASFSGGVMSLTPTEYRGACFLQTKDAVVTKLPATVTARVKYPVSMWRHASFTLSPATYIDVNGHYTSPTSPVSTITFMPGNLGWVFQPYVGGAALTYADGTAISQNFDPSPVLTPDKWIDVTISLHSRYAVFTAEGRTITLSGDIKSIVDQPGGLKLMYECDDDYNQLGSQFDSIRVE